MNNIADRLREVDMWIALGEFIRRGNAAAGSNPISPATEVMAAKASLIYGDIFSRLGDWAQYAIDVREVARDNTVMGERVAAAAKQGMISPDRAIEILQFLVADSENKASQLEAAHG